MHPDPSSFLVPFLTAAALALPAAGEEIPRPEHPNPQMQREQWLNLNGTWEFWEGDEATEEQVKALAEFPDRIVVPFCRESSLSGLNRKGFVKNVVYRREFTVPDEWRKFSIEATKSGGSDDADEEAGGGRVLLHIGACDWRTVVWVNGKRVGFHEGGSAPITCDVTSALKPEPGVKNELRVWAFDDTRSKLQQCGKQSDKDESYSCVYTRTTGIWQTVWMERVGSTYVSRIDVSAKRVGSIALDGEGKLMPGDPGNLGDDDEPAIVIVSPRLSGPTGGANGVVARLLDGDKVLAVRGAVDAQSHDEMIEFTIPKPKRWSPESPHLYRLLIEVRANPERRIDGRGGGGLQIPQLVDRVESYFGIRDVEVDGPRVLLNGKPVFQRLILDQGFYPDGIWTAPSDEALKRDIELSMAAGFNGARLHQKVFEPRFHYWADKLGYLTWGESASWGNDNANPATHRVVMQEWVEILERDRNHPSIIGWCPFNETGASSGPLQNAVTTITRAIDPTRLLLDTSGYVHSDALRDVDDAHDYDQDPATFRARWWPNEFAASLPDRYGAAAIGRDRPFFVSEYGGIGWIPTGEEGWGYGGVPKSEPEWFLRFGGLCDAQLDNPSLFGFCYTQLTDVEQEKNGLYFYDRRPKFDVAKVRAIVARPAAIEKRSPVAAAPREVDWKVVISSAVDAPVLPWIQLATTAPLEGDDWRRGELAGRARPGFPGFGRKEGFDVVVGTPWTTSDLYLRRDFEWDGAAFERALLVLHHDEDVTVCVNGEELFSRKGWNDRYEPFDVTEKARSLLKPGINVVAAHVHQSGGGQYFDLALLVAPRDRAIPADRASGDGSN